MNKDILPDFVDNSLKNITDEPTKQAGNIIKDLIYLKFGHISTKAEQRRILERHGLNAFEEVVKNHISQIPPKNLIAPDFQTFQLALDSAEYCIDSDILRENFAKLLANSCNTEYKDYVHPSFPEILKQMSPFDAQVLKFFAETRPSMVLTYTMSATMSDDYLEKVSYILDDYPYTDDIEKVSTSFSSLMRFGILGIHNDAIESLAVGTNFHKTQYYIDSEQERMRTGKYNSSRVTKLYCTITPFGHSFIRVCV